MTFSITATNKADLLAQVADITGLTLTAPTGTGTGAGTGTGTTPPPTATDPQTLPLTIPAAYKAIPDQSPTGAVLDGGTGPDRLDFKLSCTPGETLNSDVSIAVNGKPYFVNLRVKGNQGLSGSNNTLVTIHGVFGTAPKVAVGSGLPNGNSNLWINSVKLNYVTTLVANGDYDARDAMSVNRPDVWNNTNNLDVIYTLPVTDGLTTGGKTGAGQPTSGGTGTAPPIVYTATASVISGAKINGAAAVAATLDKLLAAIPAGGTLQLPAGSFIGAGVIPAPNVKVLGDPVAKTTIDCTGFRPYQDKAVFVLRATGTYFKDLKVTGAAISDALGANAAGFRADAPSVDYTLENVEVYGNQDGELDGQGVATGNVTHINCNFHDNGATGSSAGFVHNVYIGGLPTSVVTINGGSYTKPIGGHAFKCRAGTLKMTGTVLESGPDGACLDFPNGGLAALDGVTLRKLPGSPTHNVVTFALENQLNAATGMTLTLNNCILDDPSSIGIFQGDATATLNLTGKNTYNGPTPPSIKGWKSVVGAFVKAG
jgi:hypothetical protein